MRESAGGDGDMSGRELVVDCPPLNIRRVWLLMGIAEAEDEVAAFITYDDGDPFYFTAPPVTSDPRVLEAVLLSAYESAFAGCSP